MSSYVGARYFSFRPFRGKGLPTKRKKEPDRRLRPELQRHTNQSYLEQKHTTGAKWLETYMQKNCTSAKLGRENMQAVSS